MRLHNIFIGLLLTVTQSVNAAATQPAGHTNSPSSAMHGYFQAIDSGDRKAALGFWNTSDPTEAKVAGLQVDMMLAISKLKKAVATKIGELAPLDLGMAVVGEGECKDINAEVKDGKAAIKVISIDPQQAQGSYSMVKVGDTWKLSATDQAKERPANVPTEKVIAAGKAMIKVINDAADGVTNGRLRSADEVKQNISQSMGGP